MKLLTETIIWIFIIDRFVNVHFYIIKWRKKEPNHTISFIVAFVLSIVVSYITYDTLTFFLLSIPYLGLIYWIWFDISLNMYREYNLLYNGKKSVIDRLEEKFRNPGLLLGLKIILIIMLSFILLDIKFY